MASAGAEFQVEARAKLNAEQAERAYAALAASVDPSNRGEPVHVDDVEARNRDEAAIRACLRYLGVNPGSAPEGPVDISECIEWLCRPSGTMHRRVRLDDGWQKDAFGVLLGHLDTGETIALIPKGTAGYYYHDPETGKKTRVSAKAAAHIRRDAVMFYRPLPARPLNARDLTSFAFSTFSRADYLIVIGAALTVAIIGLLPAWANRVAFGVVAPSGQAGLVLPIAVLLLGVAWSSLLISVGRSLVMTRVSLKLDVAAQSATFARMLSLPSRFFRDYPAAELSRRADYVTSLCQQMVSILLGSGLSAVLSLVYVFQIAAFTPTLAIPALVIILIQAVLGVSSTFVAMRYEKAAMEADAKTSGLVAALIGGIQKIKLAGSEDLAFGRWARGYAAYAKATYNRPFFVTALPAIIGFVSLAGNIAIYYLAATSSVTYDNYMAFNVAYGQTTGALMALTQIGTQIAQAKPMVDMIEPIMRAVPETDANRPSVSSLTGEIEVSGVSFRYGENLPYVLRDLSLHIRPGEYVGIVGESGSGKSTLMRLLLGFEDPEAGSVFFDTHDVSKVNLRSLRRHIGTVLQDSRLFAGDILSNIVISSPSTTMEDAWEAAEVAGIADDIRRMPMGMHTVVSQGGGGLSGGQRQRVMIARAVCGGRRILFFDEATSALDNKTQQHVADALAKLECTRVVIAHRLSTVRDCDRILVLDGGAIVEEGAYDELMSRGGVFADLVARQQA